MSKMGERKIRADKKTDLRATMSVHSKARLYDFSDVCGEPIKNVAERLIVLAAASRDIVGDICIWFRRDYIYNGTIAFGDTDRPKLAIKSIGSTDTVSIKFKRSHYDSLCSIAYALDITPSSAASLLIVTAMKHPKFMNEYLATYATHLDENRLKMARKILNI